MVRNPPSYNLAVSSVLFYQDELAPGIEAGHAGCAGPRAIIKHRVALVRVGSDKVLKEGNGFLGGVQSVPVAINF